MNEAEAGDDRRPSAAAEDGALSPADARAYQRHDAYRHPDEPGKPADRPRRCEPAETDEGQRNRQGTAGEHGHEPGEDGDGVGDKDKDAGSEEQDGKGGKEKKKSPFSNPKVRIGLILLALFLLLAFALWFHHYWTIGRYQQSTNDAYLQADQVTVSSKVPGYVEKVFVQDNQQVRAGDPLVQIDPRDARAQAAQAQAKVDQGLAAVAATRAQIGQQEAEIAVAEAQVRGARATLLHAQATADRYRPLTAEGAHSRQELEQVLEQRDKAAAQVKVAAAQTLAARRAVSSLRAQIGSAEAQIEAARATLRQAEVDLSSTTVRASIDGRVGDRSVRIGQFVQPGTKLMSVVPVSDVYLVANFKETQVGLMRVGQPATIEVDALPDTTLHGKVQSFAPGTGAQFALLPPQNATGNFTKVVQRVPVRITLEAGPEARKVLVPGLSVDVTVDTLGAKETRERAKDESEARKGRRQREDDSAEQAGREQGRKGVSRGPGS